MKWFKKLLTVIALFNIVLTPVARAQEAKKPVTPEEMRDVLESMGYELKVDKKAGKALVYEKGSDKVVMELPFAQESTLRKFSPKSMNQMMLEEVTRVRAASKASWSHSVRSLPTESAIFFMAMGAVVAGQLITNYAQNPVAMKQHMDHSMSPLGVFGFFTFMYSQGVTSNVLSMYLQNPKYHHMIPYLGMTVGAFLQTYLSSFASDPNVRQCAASWIQTKDANKVTEQENPEACEKAYEYFLLHKKIWEFAPGIVSMLISSGLAAVGQSVVTKAVLRITGVDIALWLTPGTMQLKGVRLLLVKGLQITAFVAIDAWLNRKVTYIWKNIFDGADFYDQNDRLNGFVNDMKAASWNKDEKDLIHEVKGIREKMTAWRMMNMSAVYEAHQNWSESLHQMTSMYNSSYATYKLVTDQIRTARVGKDPAPLAAMMQMSGVKSNMLEAGKEFLYFSKPLAMEAGQMGMANDVALKIDKYLTSKDPDMFLYPPEIEALKKISALLKGQTTDKGANPADVVLKGIVALKALKDNVEANITSQSAIEVVRDLWTTLGDPVMPKGLGQGYLAAFEKSQNGMEVLAGTNYYRVTGAFQTPKITDYLVMQMICGPDVEAGGKVVRNSKGYPSVFLPPQLGKAVGDLFACSAVGANLESDEIYSREIESGGKKYKGAIPYLLATARPEAIGTTEQSNFDDWWNKNTQQQIQNAFAVYSSQYQSIVADLIEGIFEPGKSQFNGSKSSITWSGFVGIWDKKQRQRNMEGGPIFNGGMKSSMQEERIYLALLQELLNPSQSFNLEFAKTLDAAPTDETLRNVDAEFKKLESLLRRIQVKNVDGRKIVSSDLENYELEEQVKNIQNALKKVASKIGVGDEAGGSDALDSLENLEAADAAAKTAPTPQLPKGARRELAVQTLQQLQDLAAEIMMYGSMANAVSWEKIRDMKRTNAESNVFQNELQAKVNQLRGVLGARH